MYKGEFIETTCNVEVDGKACGKAARAVKVVSKNKRGMWWICDDGHESRTCTKTTKRIAG